MFPNFASFSVNGWTHTKLGTPRGQKGTTVLRKSVARKIVAQKSVAFLKTTKLPRKKVSPHKIVVQKIFAVKIVAVMSPPQIVAHKKQRSVEQKMYKSQNETRKSHKCSPESGGPGASGYYRAI
jgi:hypothetical protein